MNTPPMSTPPGEAFRDLLDLYGQLSPEERLVSETAAAFCEGVLAPKVTAAFEAEVWDRDLLLNFGKMGLLGVMASPEFGGSGLSHVAYGLVAREVERIDSGYRSALSVQSSLVIGPIEAFGSRAQKEKWLPKLISGENVGCFGLTEASAGSDPGSLATTARRVFGGYCLKGSKMWITHAPVADVAVVWAYVEGENGREGLGGFLVERGMEGFSTPSIDGKMSLRTSPTGELIFDDVFLPSDARLPGALGFSAPFSCLNKARYGIAWGAMGAAEACWLGARSYAMERHQFGAPLASRQLVQYKLADMQTEIALGLQGVLTLGRLLDRGAGHPCAISLLKRNNARKALEIARLAREIYGANGIMASYGIMRHLLNLETVVTYEGTSDIHALILGKEQTGFSAF